MTEADPIEPPSEDDSWGADTLVLAMIRDEVWQIARQVRELTAEVDRIKRSLSTGDSRHGTDEVARWAVYEIREQQMTQMLTSMVNALQFFLQQRVTLTVVAKPSLSARVTLLHVCRWRW